MFRSFCLNIIRCESQCTKPSKSRSTLLYACSRPFNLFYSPDWHATVKAIHNAPKWYKSPKYEKARTVLLDRKKADVQSSRGQFTDERPDSGFTIVSDS
jgi:hypothetical protein